MRHDDDLNSSATERMKRNYARRRWSDSPTLVRDADLPPNRKLQLTADHDLTQSLHDLTEPILPPVSKLSSVSQTNLSTSTLQSEIGVRTKSQDSGFNKSASYLSLHSTSRKYSHVESKVKKYVQDIKDAEALRKMSLSSNSVNNCAPVSNIKVKRPVVEAGENVEEYIEKLQADLQDKDALLRALQGSYEDLLLKHAEAENKIDHLRLRSLESSPAWHHRSRRFFRDGFDFQHSCSPEKDLTGSRLSCFTDTTKLSSSKEQHDGSCELFDGSFSPTVSESILLSPGPQSDQEKSDIEKVNSKEVVIGAPLGPIQKLYSSSVRLDKVLQPLSHCSPKSDDSKFFASSYKSQSLPQVTTFEEIQVEGKEASDAHSEENNGTKSNMYYTTADTGMSNNLYHLTTDTGIEDCIQSATDKDTENEIMKIQGRVPIGSQLCVPNFPNEDPFSKVQRWRDSLPNNITDRRVESTTKLKKTRYRKPALPRKSIGVQTTDRSNNICLCSEERSLCLSDAINSSINEKRADFSENDDYAESFEITDCDNFPDISCRSAKKKSWSTNVTRTRKGQPLPRSKSVEPLNRHRCCGECKTCGSAIIADARPPEYPSSSTSYFSHKEKSKESSQRKLRSGVGRGEKIRRDSPCLRKTVRCPRIAGAHVTRAVLLDMLLNVQSGHSCCCCCQHMWRGRQLASAFPNEGSNQEKVSENALQRCLAEIQKIAWDLNEKLAQSHAGLVNLSCRKKD